MITDVAASLLRVLARLSELASADDQLRRELRALGEALVRFTDSSGAEPTPVPDGYGPPHSRDGGDVQEPPTERFADAEPSADAESADAESADAESSAELALSATVVDAKEPEQDQPLASAAELIAAIVAHQAPPAIQQPTFIEPPDGFASDGELSQIARALELKADGCEWAVERRALIEQGSDVRARDRALFDRGREEGVLLWMNHPSFVFPADPLAMLKAAQGFKTASSALLLVIELGHPGRPQHESRVQALGILAAALSGLRVAIEQVRATADRDQAKLFGWLSTITSRDSIYIERHMRRADRFDPSGLSELQEKIDSLRLELKTVAGRRSEQASRLKQAAYHASRIAERRGDRHDWEKIVESVSSLVGNGLPPSSLELRRILGPIVEQRPELGELPTEFVLVLREVGAASRPSRSTKGAEDVPIERSADVLRVRAALGGSTMLMIGGTPRVDAKLAIESELGLNELIWEGTQSHQSVGRFEPIVARPEVAVVLLLIRWSSHSFGEIDEVCERYGKALVRLTRGYSPGKVAFDIIEQRGRALGIA